MFQSTQKNYVSNPHPWELWLVSSTQIFFFVVNCIKCADLHRKITFLRPTPDSWIWEFKFKYQKKLFDGNCMKCADLHKKILYLTPTPIVEGSSTKICFAMDCIRYADVSKKSCFQPHPMKVPKNILARN